MLKSLRCLGASRFEGNKIEAQFHLRFWFSFSIILISTVTIYIVETKSLAQFLVSYHSCPVVSLFYISFRSACCIYLWRGLQLHFLIHKNCSWCFPLNFVSFCFNITSSDKCILSRKYKIFFLFRCPLYNSIMIFRLQVFLFVCFFSLILQRMIPFLFVPWCKYFDRLKMQMIIIYYFVLESYNALFYYKIIATVLIYFWFKL